VRECAALYKQIAVIRNHTRTFMDQLGNVQPKTAENQQPVVMDTTNQNQPQAVASQAPVNNQAQLPPDAPDRTKAEFEKLLQSNREMHQKLSQYEAKPKSAVEYFTQPQTVISEIEQVTPDENGYVDIAKVNATVAQINNALKSVKTIQENVSTVEQRNITRQVYAANPELNPQDTQTFDPKYNHLVKLELLRQMTEEGTQDYMRAAELVRTNLYDPRANRPAPKNNEAIEQRMAAQPMAQANGGNQPSRASGTRDAMLKGDADSIGKYLTEAGF